MATATDNEAMLKLSAERGYTLLTTFQETPQRVRIKTERYVKYALAAGQHDPLKNIVGLAAGLHCGHTPEGDRGSRRPSPMRFRCRLSAAFSSIFEEQL